jgi:hypothetical protein
MRLEQIGFYLTQFDRLLKEGGTFYFKQWKRGVVPFEDVVIHQRDYPFPKIGPAICPGKRQSSPSFSNGATENPRNRPVAAQPKHLSLMAERMAETQV